VHRAALELAELVARVALREALRKAGNPEALRRNRFAASETSAAQKIEERDKP